jgi:putative two-component system response regulator
MGAKAALRRLTELRSHETFLHEQRVGALAYALSARLGLPPGTCEAYRHAAELHDVGKLALPDTVLEKPGPLSPAEYALVQRHTEYGHDLLMASGMPELALAAEVALSHHERWDGSGYPHALRGEAVPPAARLVALCDVYAALREERAYKAPLSHEATRYYLLHGGAARKGPGSIQFDPALLAVLASAPEVFEDAFARG